MSNDQLSIVLGVIVGVIAVPWCAWVTTSIFNLKTQTALFREELKVTERLERAIDKLSSRL